MVMEEELKDSSVQKERQQKKIKIQHLLSIQNFLLYRKEKFGLEEVNAPYLAQDEKSGAAW